MSLFELYVLGFDVGGNLSRIIVKCFCALQIIVERRIGDYMSKNRKADEIDEFDEYQDDAEEYDESESEYEEYQDEYEEEYDNVYARAEKRHKRRVRNQAIAISVVFVLIAAVVAGAFIAISSFVNANKAQKQAEELQKELEMLQTQEEEPVAIEAPEE